jgi:hypothetical protein
MAKIQCSDKKRNKRKIAILSIDSILDWIILSRRNIEVLNFTSPNWVYMLKSVEKWLCKTRKYKIVFEDAILITPPFWIFEKKCLYNIFFMNWCFQIQYFKWFRRKLTELWNIRVLSGGHLDFLRHFEVLFLKIHIFLLFGLGCQNMSLDQCFILTRFEKSQWFLLNFGALSPNLFFDFSQQISETLKMPWLSSFGKRPQGILWKPKYTWFIWFWV